MENTKENYIKADDNKVINERHIRWIKKMDDCLEICTKSNGCNISYKNTHKICKLNNIDSYNKMNELFME